MRLNSLSLNINLRKLIFISSFILLFTYHCSFYYGFCLDDSFISFRYGERLFQGKGLSWNDNEYIEGYSNIFWTIFVAFFNLIFNDVILTASILSISSILLSYILIANLFDKDNFSTLSAYVALLLICTTPSLAIHAVSGIEHCFLAATLFIALYLFNQLNSSNLNFIYKLILSFTLSILATIRLDAPVLVYTILALAILLNIKDKDKIKSILFISILPTITLIIHVLFRFFYYGKLVPHTASVKVSFNSLRFNMGFNYIYYGFINTYPIWIAGLICIAILIYKRKFKIVTLCSLTSAIWLVYLVSSGGDIFYGRRQFLISYIPIFFLIIECSGTFNRKNAKSFLYFLIISALTLQYFRLGLLDRNNYKRVKKYAWVTDAKYLGENLNKAFYNHSPTLAVDSAGSLPFYSKFKSIDMLGLTNEYMLKATKVIGGKTIGHELGSGKEVIKRTPDIIAFNSSIGKFNPPTYKSGKELVKSNFFKNEYKPVIVNVESLVHEKLVKGLLYIRYKNGKIGINKFSNTKVVLPSYFFLTKQGNMFIENKLLPKFNANEKSILKNVELPRGKWKYSINKGYELKYKKTYSSIFQSNNYLLISNENEALDIEITNNSYKSFFDNIIFSKIEE